MARCLSEGPWKEEMPNETFVMNVGGADKGSLGAWTSVLDHHPQDSPGAAESPDICFLTRSGQSHWVSLGHRHTPKDRKAGLLGVAAVVSKWEQWTDPQ